MFKTSLNSQNRFLIFILVMISYALLGAHNINLATINNNASPIWLPSGLAIGLILLYGPWLAPAIYLGAFLTNLSVQTPIEALFMIATGNMLEALTGARIIRLALEKNFLKSYTEFFAIGVCALFASTISATFGAASLYFFSTIPSAALTYTWFTWWSGDVIGSLLVLPIMLEFYKGVTIRKWGLKKIIPGVFFLTLISSIASVVLYFNYNQSWLWLLVPALLYGGVIVGNLMLRIILILLSALVISFIKNGFGPFEYGNLNLDLIYLQCLLAGFALAVIFAKPFIQSFSLGPRFILANLLAWFSLFVVIFLTSSMEKKYLVNDFKQSVHIYLTALNRTIDQHDTILNSSKALFTTNPGLQKNEWASFVESLELSRLFGPSDSLGYIKIYEKKRFEKDRKKLLDQGVINKEVRILDENYSKRFSDHYLSWYIYPQKFLQNITLDIGSEKNRRETAWKAKRLKESVATGPIKLQRSGEHRGFLILHPIWDKQNNFLGWIFAPILSNSFFSRSWSAQKDPLNIKVSVDDLAVYQHGEPPHNRQSNNYKIKKEISIFGVNHLLEFQPSSQFFVMHAGITAPLALMLVLFILLISSFFLEQMSFGKKVEAMINERTKELELSKMQLVHSSKMASLGEMASGMAHEIYNPLTIILGKIEVLSIMLRDLNIDDGPLLTEISKIKLTTNRIGKIVNGLKTFSRSSNDDPFDLLPLKEVVQETLDLCSERFKSHGIKLEIDKIPMIYIHCRPSQLSQVLLNLFNNSFDAVESLDEKWVQLSFNQTNSCKVQMIITDSGPGISPDIADRIMEPFFTTKEVNRGTGLGLSIVKGIIESHNGKVWLDSSSKNTKFIVELPYEE